jgi:diphosphate-dependent phosphofructokinase
MSYSPLQQARLDYQPQLPSILHHLQELSLQKEESHSSLISSQITRLFPLTGQVSPLKFIRNNTAKHQSLRVGVVLSGGQAPGGHNVITGLYDALQKLNKESVLLGFLNGPNGIVQNHTIELTRDLLKEYRNQGGFDVIGSGRTKIETEAQFQAALNVVTKHQLDGLVVVGGDDSNTNAALLAEYFVKNECHTCVVGVPKTIDGDLKSKEIEVSFGFDTASKHYSETIGSLMRDALSARKYYYFIKLMGRSASHITLECALQTHPNLTLISEEVAVQKQSFKFIIKKICDLICARAAHNKDFGVILIPEGVVEFIPEMKQLIQELNELLASTKEHHAKFEQINDESEKIAYISKWLSKDSLDCFQMLPKNNQAQLLIGRDPHGNVQVSKIETERMIIEMVKKELKKRTNKGEYTGTFNPLSYFCGYEGRSCLPSNFDCNYCYALGHIAALLIEGKATGYLCCLKNLAGPVSEWTPIAIPITTLMAIEQRHGEPKPVIQKALVDLNGNPFKAFLDKQKQWEMDDVYSNPGPIQFFGPKEIVEASTLTLQLESQKTYAAIS